MTIADFAENYLMYENMSIWEIKSIPEFSKAHESLIEIFEKEYGFPFTELSQQKEFPDTEMMVVSKLLNYFDNKYFLIFSNNDKHHNELKSLQDRKIMNFGIDIHVIHPTSMYVLEMDKANDLQKYDR